MIATRSLYLAKTSAKTSRRDRSSQYPFARYRAANSGGNRTTPSSIHLLASARRVQVVPIVQSVQDAGIRTSCTFFFLNLRKRFERFERLERFEQCYQFKSC